MSWGEGGEEGRKVDEVGGGVGGSERVALLSKACERNK